MHTIEKTKKGPLGISAEINYERIAHKVASERGVPETLQKTLGPDVTKRMRLRELSVFFPLLYEGTRGVFSSASYRREGIHF